jgi:hypothetical protein
LDTEADTCRKFVVPKLQLAGWDELPFAINEQRTFTDGRVIFIGGKPRRGRQKRADYILRYRSDFPIAVVEAKSKYRSAEDAVQQAKNYVQQVCLLEHGKMQTHSAAVDTTTQSIAHLKCWIAEIDRLFAIYAPAQPVAVRQR